MKKENKVGDVQRDQVKQFVEKTDEKSRATIPLNITFKVE